MIFYRNVREITFRLTNVIPERIIFVSRGITMYQIMTAYKGHIMFTYCLSATTCWLAWFRKQYCICELNNGRKNTPKPRLRRDSTSLTHAIELFLLCYTNSTACLKTLHVLLGISRKMQPTQFSRTPATFVTMHARTDGSTCEVQSVLCK